MNWISPEFLFVLALFAAGAGVAYLLRHAFAGFASKAGSDAWDWLRVNRTPPPPWVVHAGFLGSTPRPVQDVDERYRREGYDQKWVRRQEIHEHQGQGWELVLVTGAEVVSDDALGNPAVRAWWMVRHPKKRAP